MNDDAAPFTLAGEFPPVSRDQWLAQVGKVLIKGDEPPTAEQIAVAIGKRLVTTTYDGIALQPLVTSHEAPAPIEEFPGIFPYTRGGSPTGARHRDGDGWDVRQRVTVRGDGAGIADTVLAELERGTTSLFLDLASSPSVDVDVLDRALTGVYLELVAVVLDAGDHGQAAAQALLDLWDRRGTAGAEASGTLGLDPIGRYARSGGTTALAAELAATADIVGRVADARPRVRTVVVDGTRFHDAGASDGQELAAAIASGVEYLRSLTNAGIDLEVAAGQIEFRLAATAEQFPTVAKFRAARTLWARVTDVAGVAGAGRRQHQHAVTSRAMWTAYDPAVNMLRATTACFAAGIAGADAITIDAFDSLVVLGGSELGRRMARNTQVLLMDESSLARVIDPAAGSWYVEQLTEQIEDAAWAAFQEIEAEGGLLASLRAGGIGGRIAATRDARDRNIAKRKDPLTGLSEFPNIDEPLPSVVLDSHQLSPLDTEFAPLTAHRYAEHFERQRRRADRASVRPSVFLATLGAPAVHTARATFAKNLFEVAGIRASVAGAGFDDVDAVLVAFAESASPLACICSTDGVYAERAAETAKALKAAGATRVYLAGQAGAAGTPLDRAVLEAAGVDEFLFTGCDVLDAVTRALDVLGVRE